MAGTSGTPLWQKKAWVIERPIYARFKKHKCLICEGILSITEITHYGVKKGSDEAFRKPIRFDIYNHPIDYTFSVFICEKCGNILSISDQYFLENSNKKDRRKHDDYHQYLQSTDKQTGGNEYSKYLESLEKQKSILKDNTKKQI